MKSNALRQRAEDGIAKDYVEPFSDFRLHASPLNCRLKFGFTSANRMAFMRDTLLRFAAPG